MPLPLKILIVEDRPLDAEMLLRELRRAGFEPDWRRVETESDYAGALHAGLDLIFSDYAMPSFSGMRALEVLRERGLTVPFILVSGTIGEETAVNAMKLGAADYLLKDRLGRIGPVVMQVMTQARLRRERLAAEEATTRLEAKYRSIFEHSVEGLYQTSFDGRLLIANPMLARIAGYASPEEMIADVADVGEKFYVNIEDRERFRALMQAEGTVRGFEAQMRRRDGTLLWISSDARAIRDEAGNVGFEGALRDITERKNAEAAVQTSELRFRTTLETLMEGCQIIGHDWRYLYVNEMAARHGRHAVSDFLGRTMMEVYPGIEATPMFAAFRRSLEEGTPGRMESELFHADGSSEWFQLVIQPVPDGLFVLSLDITARKQAEEKIRGQIEELQRWHEVTLGREERIISLKQEVNALLAAAGAPPRYQGGDV